MDDKFFLVWNPNGMGPPRFRHPTFDSAKKEAIRLGTENPGQTFHVLENIGHAKTPAAVFTSVSPAHLTITEAGLGEAGYGAPVDTICIVLDPLSSLTSNSSQPARTLKHGEYQPGDRVRYTARAKFTNLAWLGRTGIITYLNEPLADIVFDDDKDRDATVHVVGFEHESLPQFEVGDEVRTRSGDLGIIESMGATTASIMGSDGHGFTTHYSLLTLVCPRQRRGGGR